MTRSGVRVPVLKTVSRVAIDGKDYLVESLVDITERKQAEEALRESEERYRALVENSLMGVGISRGNQVIFANPALLRIFGYDNLEEFARVSLLDHVAPSSRAYITERVEKVARDEPIPPEFEYDVVRQDGQIRTLHAARSSIVLSGEKYTQTTFQDITERKQAEEALRLTQFAVDRASDAMFWVRLDARLVYVNNAACERLGYSREELLAMTVHDIDPDFPMEVWPDHWEEVKERGSFAFESHHRSKDGQVFPVEVTINFVEFEGQEYNCAFVRDITERKQAEEALRENHRRLEQALVELKETQEQMLHQERLAVVGQLAAGIAHDFNNILATIVLYTQMSLRAAELSPQIRQRLEIIAEQTSRAADLVQQILDFGRRAVLERRPLALDSFLQKVIQLLERTLPESIQIGLTLESTPDFAGADEYLIEADLTRVQQALVNLALNARDAMPGGGALHIALSRTAGQEITCVDCGPVIGGEWVQVAVTDTGTGIAPDVLPRIFEPFFTTRAPLGHGLGLSQVYGIVKQHGGHIDVQTQVGQGTTFRLYWPPLTLMEPQVWAETQSEAAQGQGETILVVEDNATMRTALADVLDALGYRVLAAANGREALAVYEQHVDEVALILSDWVMPSMGGLELVRELATRRATIKVLMLTGHPLTEEVREAVPGNVVGWVLKPPSLEQLAEAVSRALAASRE